jgi:uncharacterized membrane protein
MTEKDTNFLGTYFDRDDVIRMAKLIAILSWVMAGIYIFDMLFSLGVFVLQYSRGLMPGMGFTDILQNILFTVERPLHGLLYFVALQVVSKGLLILLDVEDNLRRSARR